MILIASRMSRDYCEYRQPTPRLHRLCIGFFAPKCKNHAVAIESRSAYDGSEQVVDILKKKNRTVVVRDKRNMRGWWGIGRWEYIKSEQATDEKLTRAHRHRN